MVHDVQQQQVLDNLAMFAADPNAVPYYSDISVVGTSVSDTGSASASPSWTKAGFSSVSAAFSGSRINQDSLSLSPVTDSFRLNWMRIAYRAAVGIAPEPDQWRDCCKLIAAWDKTWPAGCPCCGNSKNCPVDAQCPLEACLPVSGWYCCGKHRDVPRHACHVGHCGDCWIWVPQEHTDELARLTLIIIGFAQSKRQVSWERACDCSGPSCTPTTVSSAATTPATKVAAPAPPYCTCTETTTIGEAGSTSSTPGGTPNKPQLFSFGPGINIQTVP
jgi:hypothetical protein